MGKVRGNPSLSKNPNLRSCSVRSLSVSHMASLRRAANPVLSLHFIFQDWFSPVNIQWYSVCVRCSAVSNITLSTWWLYEASASRFNPDSVPNIFPNLISLQYFQLEYFYFFSSPMKFEGSLCWRKCVPALQCWMNGACIWPNFLIWEVKINSKIITHLPKYCTDYGH